jgi:S1-C subfamily serine protease
MRPDPLWKRENPMLSHFWKIVCVLMMLAPAVALASEVTPASLPAQSSVEEQANATVLIYAGDGEARKYLGLGFLVKTDGTFATNFHLVDGHKDLIVKLMDGDVYSDISLVDSAPIRDLAILKFGGFDMNVVNLGNSKSTNTGETIYVLSVDENLEYGINEGEILDTGSTETGFKFFEISVEVTQASNGSAVFNGNGEVIGVANAMKMGENSFVSTCYAKFDQLMDVEWFYRFKENRVVERNPIIFQVTDRLKELTRDAGKFRKESPMDENLGKIFDEYGYLFAKMATGMGHMVTSQNTDSMDYANVSVKNIVEQDIPEVNRSFREYVVKNYPDLESTLLTIISKGPRPHNPDAAYGIQLGDDDNGVVVTQGDGKYFHNGDILLGVEDGVDFGHSYDFMRFISVLKPGAQVYYRIIRDGKTEVIKTIISKR